MGAPLVDSRPSLKRIVKRQAAVARTQFGQLFEPDLKSLVLVRLGVPVSRSADARRLASHAFA